MNIIQKSIDGITPHILRLKKLLAGVLASCWSMMLHLLFFLERVFWQIKRSQLTARIGQGYTMLESLVRQSRRIVTGWLSTSHLEDMTGTSFYDSAERQGSDHSGSTKPSSTLTQGETENGVLGTNRLGIDGWGNRVSRKFTEQGHRPVRGTPASKGQGTGLRARVKAARQTS